MAVWGTGTLTLSSSFSRQCEFTNFITKFHSPSSPRVLIQSYFTNCSPHDLATHLHPRGFAILLRPCIDSLSCYGSTGISTCCSSPTALALGLVPDLPWEDKPSPGNLRLSMVEILTPLSLLMPAFSLVCSPPPLSIWLQPAYIAPLPRVFLLFPSFGCKF